MISITELGNTRETSAPVTKKELILVNASSRKIIVYVLEEKNHTDLLTCNIQTPVSSPAHQLIKGKYNLKCLFFKLLP